SKFFSDHASSAFTIGSASSGARFRVNRLNFSNREVGSGVMGMDRSASISGRAPIPAKALGQKRELSPWRPAWAGPHWEPLTSRARRVGFLDRERVQMVA